MTKRTVLVPLDDSELSRRILPPLKGFLGPEVWDVVLFRAEPARAPRAAPGVLPALEVVVAGEYRRPVAARGEGAPPRPVFSERAWERFERTLRDELGADVRALAADGFAVSVAVHFGPDPTGAIVRFAAEAPVDLVALATHGSTPLGRTLLGSVAHDVLRRLPVPVLVVGAVSHDAELHVGAGAEGGPTPDGGGPATLAGLPGVGLVVVHRTEEGDIVDANGFWRPAKGGAKVYRLERALDTGTPVTYEGPISDPASGGVEIDQAATQVHLKGIHRYSGEDGAPHVAAHFVVLEAAKARTGAASRGRRRARYQ